MSPVPEKFEGWQFKEPMANLEKVEKSLPPPSPGYVVVQVHACGCCHSDTFTKFDAMKGGLPRCPGHEIAGEIAAVGEGVKNYKPGDRVGVGWFGGHCGECRSCAEGDFITCDKMPVTGIHYDGGYQRFVTAPVAALAPIPAELSYVEAAPLMCAGVTVFHGLRRANAPPGSNVGVQGVGGLGHLAIQVANKMGYKVFVFSRGTAKKELAMELGCHVYVDLEDPEFANKVQKDGGCKVILGTGIGGQAMGNVMQALGANGSFMILGVSQEDFPVSPFFMVSRQRKVQGHASGTAVDSADCMKFCALTGVRSRNEVYPASKAPEAFERMVSGHARFRVVIDWDKN